MLIKPDQTTPFDLHELAVHDYGATAEGAASVAVIEVPAHGAHPRAYSSRCHKLLFMLSGALRFNVDGIAYTAREGDLVIIPRGQIFDYFDCWGQPSRLLLVHVPAYDETAEHLVPNVLRAHNVNLRGERVTLRPMTEEDWDYVCAWDTDPEVLFWSDDPDTAPRAQEETKAIYRGVSLFAYVFVIELEGEPIGECWLQKLNLPEIIERFPGRDLRRIDIAIGRKDLWGKGLGSDAIRTLLRFAFERERADGVYYGVRADNLRSRRAAQKAGFGPLEGADGLIAWR